MGTLDLSAVSFPRDGFHRLGERRGGRLRIVVPANAVVELTTNVGVGTVRGQLRWTWAGSSRGVLRRSAGVSAGELKG